MHRRILGQKLGSYEEPQIGQVAGANRGREQVNQVKIKKEVGLDHIGTYSGFWILTQEQKETTVS